MIESKVREPLLCEDYSITADRLPLPAQDFIAHYFADTEIVNVTMDKELFSRSYEVLLSDGSKIEFSRAGEWDNVECRDSKVPEAILPFGILEFTANSGRVTIAIEKNRRSYDVRLDNGLELKFDLNFNIIEVDD